MNAGLKLIFEERARENQSVLRNMESHLIYTLKVDQLGRGGLSRQSAPPG